MTSKRSLLDVFISVFQLTIIKTNSSKQLFIIIYNLPFPDVCSNIDNSSIIINTRENKLQTKNAFW